MTPTGNKILFKPAPPKEITDGGLFVPDSCRKISNKGTIVAVGRGTKNNPMTLKVGMIGYRVKDWGEPYIIDNETYFLMEDKAILAIE